MIIEPPIQSQDMANSSATEEHVVQNSSQATAAVGRSDTIKQSVMKSNRAGVDYQAGARPVHRREHSRSDKRPSPPTVRIDPNYGGPNMAAYEHHRQASFSSDSPYTSYSAAFVPHYQHHPYHASFEVPHYEADQYAGSPVSPQNSVMFPSAHYGSDMHPSMAMAPHHQQVYYTGHALSTPSSSASQSHPSPHDELSDGYLGRPDVATTTQTSPATFSGDSSPIHSPLTPHTAADRASYQSLHQPFAYYEVPPTAFHRAGYQPTYAYPRWAGQEYGAPQYAVYHAAPPPHHMMHYPVPSSPPTVQPIPLSQMRSSSFSQQSPMPHSAWLYGSSSPPLPYSPPEELARGSLAQSHMHQAMLDPAGQPVDKKRQPGMRSNMPKPPPHSPHALWAGNVPSDATHAELWRFFTTRSPPSSSPKYATRPDGLPEHIDLSTTGVESIHLIARSNCAFVNYASDPHLQHAIAVSNDVPLRPFDPRCKALLCRVRKLTDDTKSGVGAQRQGGMHKAYVSDVERRKPSPVLPVVETDVPPDTPVSPRAVIAQASPKMPQHQHSVSSSQGATSLSTASTTSSFLVKHFPKRFFVLKSHDEKELALSVEKGVWATQAHNEPILDQAYRTCRDGVFLIFSANKSGEFYGYAKMAGPISGSEPTSLSSAGQHTSQATSTGVASDAKEDSLAPPLPAREGSTMLLSPSEERYAPESPGKIEDDEKTQTRARGASAPASVPFRDAANAQYGAQLVAANLALPDTRKAESLDPKLLYQMRNIEISEKAVKEQQALGLSMHGAEKGEDGVWRKDTLLSPEERNLRLEKLEDEGKIDTKPAPTGWNNPFRIDWIKVERVPFSRTRHIKNAFNANREVKISRDGTEIEPGAGIALIEEFWKSVSPADTVTSAKLPSPQVA